MENSGILISSSVQLVRFRISYAPELLINGYFFEGFDTTYKPKFPVIGRNGVNLQDKWKEFPVNYLSIGTDGFPNWYVGILSIFQLDYLFDRFYALGPNSGVGSGSLLILIEKEVDYLLKIVSKLQREQLKSIEVKKEAVEEFDEYSRVKTSFVKFGHWLII